MSTADTTACADPLPAPIRNRPACAGLIVPILVLAMMLTACRGATSSFLRKHRNAQPFNFQISLGPNQYQIAGYFSHSELPGRLPALLVLNGEDTLEQCVKANQDVVAMGIQLACVAIPGHGGSSGPGRFVGPQAVAAARRALDLIAARPDVDSNRLAVWGLGDGAVAAGLLMDYDSRPRALILQSGAYDMVKLWPQAGLRTKLAILHQVWPSKRVLAQRSVIRHLPSRLDCSVLILHGEKDKAMPVSQAMRLAVALKQRGARVETYYFPRASHRLGHRVDPELRAFLRQNLLDTGSEAES